MHFTTLLALALPIMATTAQETTVQPSPTPSPAPSDLLLQICETQAGPYADACPRCLYRCAASTVPEQCFFGTFTIVNSIQAQCQAQGGRNCRDRALDAVCVAQ